MARVEVHVLKVSNAGELRTLTGGDPLLGLGGGELGTDKYNGDVEAALVGQAHDSPGDRLGDRNGCGREVVPGLPSDQVGHRLWRGSAGGRPPAFDAEAYKERNTVERCINRLKQWRGLAMRTDKLAMAYRAAPHLAAILIWARW